jgi:hypothetical protein
MDDRKTEEAEHEEEFFNLNVPPTIFTGFNVGHMEEIVTLSFAFSPPEKDYQNFVMARYAMNREVAKRIVDSLKETIAHIDELEKKGTLHTEEEADEHAGQNKPEGTKSKPKTT